MTTDEGPPIYRFKPIVECVLTERQGVLTVLEADGQRFTLVGVSPHPDGGQPTYLGEIWSAKYIEICSDESRRESISMALTTPDLSGL